MRSWFHDHDGRTDEVWVVLAVEWPKVQVRIRPHGRDVAVWGNFSSTGRLEQVAFQATADHAEVSTADLRWAAVIRSLKEWEIVAREIARQVLAGKEPDEAVFDARKPTEALRILSQSSSQRRRKTVRRGAEFEQLLRDIARAYREAVAAGDPKPRVTLAAQFGYSNAHVGWLLTQARKSRRGRPPLLGPARPGKAGEDPGDG